MKHLLFCILAVLCLSSCKDILNQPLHFEVKLTNEDIAMVDSVYQVPKGSKLDFLFEGNPDFISTGYYIFNETNVELSFITSIGWADNNHNVEVYLSDEPLRLSLSDVRADSLAIANHPWKDITSLCAIPSGKNQSDTTRLDMSAYKDQTVTLAFHYKTESNKAYQPMVTLSQLTLLSWIEKTQEEVSKYTAKSMNLVPFDNYVNDSTTYLSSQEGGKWDISMSDSQDPTAIKLRQSFPNKPLNDDWLITAPLQIPRGKIYNQPATNIKTIHTTVNTYTQFFDEEGEWTIFFVATNANIKFNERVTKTFRLNVY